jgi:hypothetical protein
MRGFLDIRHEAGLGLGVQDIDLDAEHIEGHPVIEIPRRGQDHAVARPGQSQHHAHESLIAARRDGYLCLGDFRLIDAPGLGRVRGAQPRVAQNGAVAACLARSRRLAQSFEH